MTRWGGTSRSPSREVRWSNPTANTPGRPPARVRHGRGGPPGVRPGSPPLGQPGMVGGQHRPAGAASPKAVQDRDAPGRPQDHIKGRDGVAAMGRPSSSPVGWRPSNMAWNPAGDASPSMPRVVVPAPCQRPGDSPWPDRYCWWSVASSRVGGLPTHRQLGDVGHHPRRSPPRRRWRQRTHPWCVALFGKWFGVRVGRKQACERRLPGVRGRGYFLMRSDRQM
jgi:hypothetical protein